MSATPAKVKSLVDELIHSVTGLTVQTDPENFSLCREFALRNFKGYKFARTDQFDVASKLDGLEEKFRIYGRDGLATALRSRLDELPSLAAGFTPEILSLFLLLSDRPLQKSKLADLELLAKPGVPQELTWQDIIAEEPLEGEIWVDVDFAAESSDGWSDDGCGRPRSRDEFVEGLVNDAEEKKRRREGWVGVGGDGDGEGGGVVGVEGFTVDGDEKGVEELKMAQYWNGKVDPVDEEVDVSLAYGGVENLSIVSELQAVREVLFMLLGHPCLLFERADDGGIRVYSETLASQFALRHLSLSAFRAILGWYAEKGTDISVIRTFVKSKTSISDFPERQTFVASVESRLAILDRRLIDLQELLVVGTNNSDQIVSLLALQGELEPFLHPFILLSQIISKLSTPSASHKTSPADIALKHLQHLFNSARTLQSTGDNLSFKFMTDIFFACLQTYLRPIRQWMESGELRSADKVFLVTKTRTDEEVELGGLWHDQYSLRRNQSGTLDAPTFIHAAASRIFITGKSVVFLKRLAEHGIPTCPTPPSHESGEQSDIALSSVCSGGGSLAPFSDTFAATLDRWIDARHHSASSRLRDILYRHCGLWKALDAIEHVYLCKDGHVFDSFARAVFEKVDRGVETWGDRFLLTELLQGVYANVGCVDAGRLRARVRVDGSKNLREKRRTVKMWRGVEIEYALPWPITNLIRKPSFKTYNSLYTLLLQLRRAKTVLERLTLLKIDFDKLDLKSEAAAYHSLRHSLLWFVNVVYHHLTEAVIAPRTAQMRLEMGRAGNVDAMVEVHERYIERVKEECLLGDRLAPMLQAVTSILDIAILFSDAQLAHVAALAAVGEVSVHDVSVFMAVAPSRRGRRRRRGSEDWGAMSDSDEDGREDDTGVDMESYISFENDAYLKQIGHMRKRFDTLVEFVKGGLRGVARAGVMPHLEALAEDLEGPGRGGGVVA